MCILWGAVIPAFLIAVFLLITKVLGLAKSSRPENIILTQLLWSVRIATGLCFLAYWSMLLHAKEGGSLPVASVLCAIPYAAIIFALGKPAVRKQALGMALGVPLQYFFWTIDKYPPMRINLALIMTAVAMAVTAIMTSKSLWNERHSLICFIVGFSVGGFVGLLSFFWAMVAVSSGTL